MALKFVDNCINAPNESRSFSISRYWPQNADTRNLNAQKTKPIAGITGIHNAHWFKKQKGVT